MCISVSFWSAIFLFVFCSHFQNGVTGATAISWMSFGQPDVRKADQKATNFLSKLCEAKKKKCNQQMKCLTQTGCCDFFEAQCLNAKYVCIASLRHYAKYETRRGKYIIPAVEVKKQPRYGGTFTQRDVGGWSLRNIQNTRFC